jgi:hypothetical protein
MKLIAGLLLFLIPLSIFGQKDSIWMKNNDILVGELKSLSKSVITFETDYSDKDFQIDFDEISRFSTQNLFVVNLTDNSRHTGKIQSVEAGKLQIWYGDVKIRDLDIQEIVFLSEIDRKFWKRFTGAIDFGINVAKTNNNVQITSSAKLKYSDDHYNFTTSFSNLLTDQDSVARIERKEFGISARRFIKKWYVEADLNYLSSTELGIKNRINPGLGAGRTLITTNKLYWAAGGGLNYNIEEYFDDVSQDKESVELKILTQFEMFNFSDLSLFTTVAGYPSLSEKGRFRLDYNFTFKYDLPFEFYIKTDFTLNYDNQPPVAGSESDYVLSTGFGWELK